ncbi:Pleckstrin y domain-containing family A member 7 [Nymphon striatum]|nr:Pleckstrin y domain-containing family A member 7 [Nymphon striatum]
MFLASNSAVIVSKTRADAPMAWDVTGDALTIYHKVLSELYNTTSWFHPVTGQPISTGNISTPDLTPAWELGVTRSGIPYYVE